MSEYRLGIESMVASSLKSSIKNNKKKNVFGFQVYVFGRGYADKSIDIPYHMIAISLISFVIPMAIGVLVKHKKPEMADRIQSLVSRSCITFIFQLNHNSESKNYNRNLPSLSFIFKGPIHRYNYIGIVHL